MTSWTKAQQAAIEAKNGPILVSAAAGSGKTTVLVERVARLILDEENPLSADSLLIVTFTEAAAAEMKERIAHRIAAIGEENPHDLRIIRQQALISSAKIGTIHSFCLELIRQNFQHLPITGEFSIADDGELRLIRLECVDEVVESFYAKPDNSEFIQLVELLSTGRDDSRMADTLLKLYDFARAHPNYLGWLDKVEALYHNPPPVEQTDWGQSLLGYAARTLEHCLDITQAALRLSAREPVVSRGYSPALEDDVQVYTRCLAAVKGGDWDGAMSVFDQVAWTRLGIIRGPDHAELKDRVKAMRKKAKDMLEALQKDVFISTRDEFAQEMTELAPKVSVLFELCREFDKAFAGRKLEKKRMDFADLEHFAAQLLLTPNGNGGYTKTERAAELSRRYGAVLVDEFQDVNEVQNLIFTSVSSEEQGNLFLVGDAKQSIYSFRQATPQLFIERKEGSYSYESGRLPAKIILGENFRSREEVTAAVNFIFSLAMSSQMGEMNYGREDELVFAAEGYPPHPDAEAEFLLVDTKSAEDEEGDGLTALEARAVAGRIKTMLERDFKVTDKQTNQLRRAHPGDFCLLIRAPKGRVQTYTKALEEAGIPVWSQGEDSFLSQREVSMVISLLEAVNNPLRDIPLAAAMASPLFGFSDCQLAAIRLVGGRGRGFYHSLIAASEGEDDLGERCREFVGILRHLRRSAATLPADKLLLEVYAITGALAIAQAMPQGEGRRANLLLLAKYAGDYHRKGYKQLGGFVGFISRLREGGGDLKPSTASSEGMKAVRIMSIHRSKGLEFPVVILAGTAGGFNTTDLNRNTLLHSRYGFACVRRDVKTFAQYRTIPLQAIRLESRRSLISEELRVLYVALTRAREKLIVTACPKGGVVKKIYALAGELSGGRLRPRAVEGSASLADFMVMALLHHPDGGLLRELGGCEDTHIVPHPSRWKMELLPIPSKAEDTEQQEEFARLALPDSGLVERLGERFAWKYPRQNRVSIPAKLGISSVAERAGGEAYRFAARPKFMVGARSSLTPAERGRAMHEFMQFADFYRARENLEGEIERMAAAKFITIAQAESLDTARLRDFFESSVAKRIFAASYFRRELRFLGSCGADTLGGFLDGMDLESRVALQGVADCVFIEEDGAVILDYKTDRVSTADQLIQKYGVQLNLYRHILKEALPVPIKECIIYSFALGSAIRL